MREASQKRRFYSFKMNLPMLAEPNEIVNRLPMAMWFTGYSYDHVTKYTVMVSDILLRNTAGKTIARYLTIDIKACAVMDDFEIFFGWMLLCRKAAEFFALAFPLEINGSNLL